MITAGAVAAAATITASTTYCSARQPISGVARRSLRFLITVQYRRRSASSRRPVASQDVLKVYLVGFRLDQGRRGIHNYHIARIARRFVDVGLVNHYYITIAVAEGGARLVDGLFSPLGMFQCAAIGTVLRTPARAVAVFGLTAIDEPQSLGHSVVRMVVDDATGATGTAAAVLLRKVRTRYGCGHSLLLQRAFHRVSIGDGG